MVETLTIARMGQRGDGVADTAGGPLFVSYTLPGEIVEAEQSETQIERRTLTRIVRESEARIAPVCPHFGVCGGCAVQHWRFADYAAWKRGLVIEALAVAGIETEIDDLVDGHGRGRRRAVLHARSTSHGVVQVGFAAPRAHHIVSIDRCPIFAPALDGAIAAAWALTEILEPLRKPLDLHFTASDGGLDVDIRGSGPLSSSVAARLAALAAPHRLARITRHGDLVIQRLPPTVQIGRAKVILPPGAFLQATAEAETILASLVAQHAAGSKRVADLFCGIGPFALRLAEKASVLALDSDAAAIAALRQAVATTQGLKPVDAQARDLFRRPLIDVELGEIDAVVFDPPRQGGEAQARALAQSKVRKVIAVSCNVATFARDARILIDGGYRLKRVTPVDQFRYSAHVEVVALLTR